MVSSFANVDGHYFQVSLDTSEVDPRIIVLILTGAVSIE